MTISIRMRKRKCRKFGEKNLRNNFGMKATADYEMDVATKPSFGENENG